MRTPSDNFITEKNKAENQPLYLYVLYNYDGAGHNLYLAGREEDIIFQNQLYTQFPISHDEIGENTSGEIDAVKVTIGNISRLIQAYLEIYEIRGKRLDILTIFANLDEENGCLIDTYYIDSYTANEQDVVFTLTSKFDISSLTLPGRKYSRNTCPWIFKYQLDQIRYSVATSVVYTTSQKAILNIMLDSLEGCQYQGTATSCAKTLNACRALGNQINFGGQPSVPSKGVYIR